MTSTAGDRTADDALLVRTAWFYYKDELTQAQIAERLSVSRATVARMLGRAREEGIVRIDIHTEELSALHLGRRCRDHFGLRDVVVVPSLDEEHAAQGATNQRVALAAAQYLATRLEPGDRLGVGWGDTVSKALVALPSSTLKQVSLVTLTGGVAAYLPATLTTPGATQVLERLTLAPAPFLTSSPELAASLRAEAEVASVIEEARTAGTVFIGIGAVTPDATMLVMGLQTAAQLRSYARQGAVGDILGQLYDTEGEVLDLRLHRMRVGLDIRELRDAGTVVAAAGGPAKVPAILGALRGGYVDVLVTTELVAARLLSERPRTHG